MSLTSIASNLPVIVKSLPVVINIIFLIVLVVCAWQGFKKGIIMGIVGVLVIILSLFGAQLLSDTFSYEVIPVMKPFVSGFMEPRIEETTYKVLGYEADENGNYNVTMSISDLLDAQPDSRTEICRWVYRDLGIYDNIAEDMAKKTVTYAEQNSASISSSIETILCQSITWYGGFIIAFILLFATMTVIVNLPNLSFRLPYLGLLNDLGGLAIGVFTGVLFCAIIAWVLQFTGIIIPESSLSKGIVGYFLDRNLLQNYISF